MHRKHIADSDSDSDLSGGEGRHGDMELASSHSSDDDDDDATNPRNWGRPPKHKALGKYLVIAILGTYSLYSQNWVNFFNVQFRSLLLVSRCMIAVRKLS